MSDTLEIAPAKPAVRVRLVDAPWQAAPGKDDTTRSFSRTGADELRWQIIDAWLPYGRDASGCVVEQEYSFGKEMWVVRCPTFVNGVPPRKAR